MNELGMFCIGFVCGMSVMLLIGVMACICAGLAIGSIATGVIMACAGIAGVPAGIFAGVLFAVLRG